MEAYHVSTKIQVIGNIESSRIEDKPILDRPVLLQGSGQGSGFICSDRSKDINDSVINPLATPEMLHQVIRDRGEWKCDSLDK